MTWNETWNDTSLKKSSERLLKTYAKFDSDDWWNCALLQIRKVLCKLYEGFYIVHPKISQKLGKLFEPVNYTHLILFSNTL